MVEHDRGKKPREDARFLVTDFEPAYLRLLRQGELDPRVAAALAELRECRACPRDCGVDRMAGELGACRTGRHAGVSSAFPHHGEERCLRGTQGSGTIFFSGCNLRCVFCQNADISQGRAARSCSAGEIAGAMLELQSLGCHNINFVTPEHVVPQTIEAIALAAQAGLRLPIVYNTSAYDAPASLALLDGLIDIYMPDFKLWEEQSAARYLKAMDYPERARQALREMHRQVGPLVLDAAGLARRGVLVRHLVMPGGLAEAAAIFRWLAEEVSPDTWVNVMGQYQPQHRVGRAGPGGRRAFPEIDRRPARAEVAAAYAAARAAGLWRFDE
ncbi:MAG: radical SAM protein [Planctomycetes bacterium]|nr:radical SAM protein [Planctomycetota bacterium]